VVVYGATQQGRYHDVAAVVSDGPGTKPAWAGARRRLGGSA